MGKFDKVLLASDFDDTLVDTHSAIKAGTDVPPLLARDRAALEHFIAEGGLFSVSTGRALPAFAPYAKDLPLNAPCVIANGAALYDFASERYVYTALLGEELPAHMAELLDAFPDLALEVYREDQHIDCMHPNHYVINHGKLTRTVAVEVSDFSEVRLPAIKVLFEEDIDKLRRVERFIREKPWGGEYELVYSNDHLLEFTAAGATKGGMVLRLAEMLGVARKDIYCVGDHKNDIPMLEIAAVGFAPANCVEEVRAAGAQVVCHVRDGAIADVIAALEERY